MRRQSTETRKRALSDARGYLQTHSDGSHCYRILERLVDAIANRPSTPELDGLGRFWWDMGKHDGDDCAVGIESTRKFQHPHYVVWIADARADRRDHSRTTALAEEIVSVLNARKGP